MATIHHQPEAEWHLKSALPARRNSQFLGTYGELPWTIEVQPRLPLEQGIRMFRPDSRHGKMGWRSVGDQKKCCQFWGFVDFMLHIVTSLICPARLWCAHTLNECAPRSLDTEISAGWSQSYRNTVGKVKPIQENLAALHKSLSYPFIATIETIAAEHCRLIVDFPIETPIYTGLNCRT